MDKTELARKQVALEHQYHPKREREILADAIMPLKRDNHPIWSDVYEVVFARVPAKYTMAKDRVDWAVETTMNFLTKVTQLDGKNTPSQSILFAFVNKMDKVANALLSMQLLLEIALVSDAIKVKVGTTVNGDDSVTVYPQISMPIDTRMAIAKLYSGLPMLVRPMPWTDNKTGGYITEVCQSSVILGGALKVHDKYIDLSGVNYLQSIGFKVNKTFFTTVEDAKESKWILNEKTGVKHKSGYVHNRKITEFYLDADVPFYFVQKIDNRTRSYAVGYNINPQGYDYQKASLNFAEERPLTDDGVKWMEIAIAGLYGLDKETFNDRTEWYEKKLSNMVHLAVVKKDVQVCTLDTKFMKLVEKAEEPALFEATVINLIEAHI